VDTSGWYALIDRRDVFHAKAVAALEEVIAAKSRLLTTDYVLDEAYTLVRARSGPEATRNLLSLIDQTVALDTEWIGADRFAVAKALFRKQLDQGFSFTDCTSFVVMEERGITDALTSDAHFSARGFRALLAVR
jgi:predicted nucleic acid-binding protein